MTLRVLALFTTMPGSYHQFLWYNASVGIALTVLALFLTMPGSYRFRDTVGLMLQ